MLANWLLKKIGGRKFGKFTVHPTVNNRKVTNWRIKVWRIPLICQIRQTKVKPNFLLYCMILCLTITVNIQATKKQLKQVITISPPTQRYKYYKQISII